MPTSGEQKTVQALILEHAEASGFSFLSPEEAKRPQEELELHYRHTLENLGTEPGLVGIIFRKAQNKISNPSDLQRVAFV